MSKESNKLIMAALHICIVWGQSTGRENVYFRYKCEDDSYSLTHYIYENDKVRIEADYAHSSWLDEPYEVKRRNSAKITLLELNTVVFEGYYECEPRVYRHGKWENYILLREKEASEILAQRRERNIRAEIEKRRRAQEMEKNRFAPIDDSMLF